MSEFEVLTEVQTKDLCRLGRDTVSLGTLEYTTKISFKIPRDIYPAMYCRIPENRTFRSETCEHITGLSTSINGEEYFHLLNDY